MSLGDYQESSPESDDDEVLENQSTSHDHQNHQDNATSYPQQLYRDIGPGSNSLYPHSTTDNVSMARYQMTTAASHLQPPFIPTDRSLPPREVSDETLDDAYVAFILYCNPNIPTDADTSELRKAFRLPPKSDGKTFNVHELLQLIAKLEQKEIKTWTRLAIELGVERTPDQSSQKVQQYAVRLKRWMHAMHIDAFFEYCMGKSHPYYTHIPPNTLDRPEESRDGVPAEEDLALRALLPESRPKRGRRRTEDRNEDEKEIPASKRQLLEAATPTSAIDPFHGALYPHSAVPGGSDPDGIDRYLHDTDAPDPWSAATPTVNGQQFRWRAFSKEATTPHGTSAQILSLETPTDEAMTPTVTTPMSAKSRARRRHGPTISSAWPSSGNPVTGKLRGRPPSNRSVRDGPFSTFPVLKAVEPGTEGGEAPIGTPVVSTPTVGTSVVSTSVVNTPVGNSSAASAPLARVNQPQFPPPPGPQTQSLRPQGLHLQVPPRKPSTVRMATPVGPQAPNGHDPFAGLTTAVEGLERAFAANLLQGTNWELSLDDAKSIASKAVAELRKVQLGLNSVTESTFLPMIKLLLGGDSNLSALFKDFTIQKIAGEPGALHIAGERSQVRPGRYKLTWKILIGPLKGEFTQIVSFGSSSGESFEDGKNGAGDVIGDDIDGTEFDWRRKYFELERRLREKEEEIANIRKKVLQAVM